MTPGYEHSLKLFFGFNVGPAVSLAHVERLREQTAAALEGYREHERELERLAEEETAPHAVYWLSVLRGGIHYAEAALLWCAETADRLASELDNSSDEGARRAEEEG